MLNKIMIMGRLTKEPVLRKTQSGTSVASFTVAVDRDFSGGEEKKTDFIDCVAWRNNADFVNRFFHKGTMAVVCGSLQIRTWADKEGNNRRTAEVLVDNLYFGEARKTSLEGPANSDSAEEPAEEQSEFEELANETDDLPF